MLRRSARDQRPSARSVPNLWTSRRDPLSAAEPITLTDSSMLVAKLDYSSLLGPAWRRRLSRDLAGCTTGLRVLPDFGRSLNTSSRRRSASSSFRNRKKSQSSASSQSRRPMMSKRVWPLST